jgi:DNA-binding response OmpR family regulator
MATSLKRAAKAGDQAPWRGVPPRIKALFIASRNRTGGWLAEAFAHDSASRITLEEARGSAAGLARLRDEVFDAVLVSHEPEVLDALDLIDGYRAGGADEPIIVLGTHSEQEMSALCYEAGADAYVCVTTTTTRNLIWVVARAIQRQQLVRENRRLKQAERQRLQREHDEARRLLVQQRALIEDLEAISDRQAGSPLPKAAAPDTDGDGDALPSAADIPVERHGQPAGLPAELIHHYRELLRTYVIMGTGNLAHELGPLAELLASAGVTARQTMQLHLHVLEDLLQGLGTRSARHVITRADLLVMEIMIHLAESYRQRYWQRLHPLSQLLLPGFSAERGGLPCSSLGAASV